MTALDPIHLQSPAFHLYLSFSYVRCVAFLRFTSVTIYEGADKSLARLTSRCILFDGENISFDSSLVINSTNIPPIMVIKKMYETQNLLSL